MNLEIEDILTHARSLGLRHFIFCSHDTAIEYESVGLDAGSYRPTSRQALVATDAQGRRRLKLPPRWGGHVLTRPLEFTHGIFWSFDLVRQGYFHVHLVTPVGTENRSAFWLLSNTLLARAWRSLRVTFKLAKSQSSIFCSMAAPRDPAYSVVPNRILMVTPSFARGGSEQQTFNTADLLIRRGYEVYMLALRPLDLGEPGYMEEIEARGLAYCVLPRNLSRRLSVADVPEELKCYARDLPDWLLNIFDAVLGVIKEFRPAVVHCWLDQGVVIGGLSASALGVPRIIAHQLAMVMDQVVVPEQIYREGYLALAQNPAVTFVSICKVGAVSYERWLGFGSDTFRILNNVLVPSMIRTPSAEEVSNFRKRLGLQPGTRVVSTIIRLVPQKDPELWVEAAAAIAALRPDVRFLIGGYGVLEQVVRRKISDLGLADRITMLGVITDLGLIYAATDIFMLSSRFEGLPCVLLEAQSAGRPVVATDVGGNAEAFPDGLTGHLVRQRTPQALAQAVLEILDNSDWTRRAAAEAPRFVESLFGPDLYIEKTLEIYGLPRYWSERAASVR